MVGDAGLQSRVTVADGKNLTISDYSTGSLADLGVTTALAKTYAITLNSLLFADEYFEYTIGSETKRFTAPSDYDATQETMASFRQEIITLLSEFTGVTASEGDSGNVVLLQADVAGTNFDISSMDNNISTLRTDSDGNNISSSAPTTQIVQNNRVASDVVVNTSLTASIASSTTTPNVVADSSADPVVEAAAQIDTVTLTDFEAGDSFVVNVGGLDFTHSVTADEAGSLTTFVTNLVTLFNNSPANITSGVTASASGNGETLLLTADTAGTPFTSSVSVASQTATSLVAADLVTADSVVLQGAASALASDAITLANRLTITGEDLVVNDFTNGDLSSITAVGNGYSLTVNTKADSTAVLDSSELVLATSIVIAENTNASSPAATGTGASLAALLGGVTGTIAAASGTTAESVSLVVTDYAGTQVISQLDTSMDITVQVASDTTLVANNLDAVADVIQIAPEAVVTISAEDLDDLNNSGDFQGTGALKVTDYGDDDFNSDADDAATQDVQLNGVADSLNVEVIVSDTANLDLTKLSALANAGDTITIESGANLIGTAADLLALEAKDVVIRGAGTLVVNDYQGQDLSALMTDVGNTLDLKLVVDSASVTADLISADVNDQLDRITSIEVKAGAKLTMSAELASTSDGAESSPETVAAKLIDASAGTVEITDLANQDLSSFSDGATSLTINVVSTVTYDDTTADTIANSTVGLDTTRLADVDQVSLTPGTLAQVADGDINVFQPKLAGTGDLSITNADLTTNASNYATLADDPVISVALQDFDSSQTISNAKFAKVDKLTVQGGDTFVIQPTADLSGLSEFTFNSAEGQTTSVTFNLSGTVDSSENSQTYEIEYAQEGDTALVSLPSNLTKIVGGAGTDDVVVKSSVDASNSNQQVFNLGKAVIDDNVDSVTVQVNNGEDTHVAAHVRLSDSIVHSGKASIVLDTSDEPDETADDPVHGDRLFLEVDMSRAVSGLEYSESGSNSWSSYDGLDFVTVSNFDTFSDGMGIVDPAGDLVITSFSMGDYSNQVSGTDNKLLFNYGSPIGNLNDIGQVRAMIGDSISDVVAGSEFGIGLFQKTGRLYSMGVFMVKLTGDENIDNVTGNEAALEVIPVAKFVGVTQQNSAGAFLEARTAENLVIATAPEDHISQLG